MRNWAGRAGVLAAKLAFVALGWGAVWLICGIAEQPALWWLYALAAVGAASLGLLALGAALVAEDELTRREERRKAVPVRRIERHGHG